MGKRKRHQLAREQALASPSPAQRHTFTASGLLGHDSGSPWIINVGELTALGLDVVQDCVQVIADAVAGSDIRQMNGPAVIDPPNAFVLAPDPEMTRREFLWLFAANLALYRAVYIEEARVGGFLVGVRQHCVASRSEEHTSELQSRRDLVCRLL